MNGFLFDDAKNYSKDLIAVTYLIQENDKTIAYFNYRNNKISHTDLDGSIEKFAARVGILLPKEKSHYKIYPAVKIGRLAVHIDYQKGGGYGKKIINFTKGLLTNKNKTGCKFITVECLQRFVNILWKNGI